MIFDLRLRVALGFLRTISLLGLRGWAGSTGGRGLGSSAPSLATGGVAAALLDRRGCDVIGRLGSEAMGATSRSSGEVTEGVDRH